MSRFRKRRKTHADRQGAQARDGGANQTYVAGGYAGANTWNAVPVPGYSQQHLYGLGGLFASGHANLSPHQSGLAQNANPYMAPYRATQIVGNMGYAYSIDPRTGQATVTQFPLPQPEPLPREIRAGEIIGYRAWLMGSDGSYWSMANKKAQWVGGRMDGEVDDDGHHGVHAWKTLDEARKYVADGYDSLGLKVAIGEVALWGEVVEHDLGYRAEHGEIGTIYEVVEGRIGLHSLAYWESTRHIPGAPTQYEVDIARLEFMGRKPAPVKVLVSTAPWAPPRQSDPFTITGWAILALLTAMAVGIATGL